MPILPWSNLFEIAYIASANNLQEEASAVPEVLASLWARWNQWASCSRDLPKKPREYGEMPVLRVRPWGRRSCVGRTFLKVQEDHQASRGLDFSWEWKCLKKVVMIQSHNIIYIRYSSIQKNRSYNEFVYFWKVLFCRYLFLKHFLIFFTSRFLARVHKFLLKKKILSKDSGLRIVKNNLRHSLLSNGCFTDRLSKLQKHLFPNPIQHTFTHSF